jgi:hypothetical protein
MSYVGRTGIFLYNRDEPGKERRMYHKTSQGTEEPNCITKTSQVRRDLPLYKDEPGRTYLNNKDESR